MKKWRQGVLYLLLLAMILSTAYSPAYAEKVPPQTDSVPIEVLILYDLEQEGLRNQVNILDVLAGQFTHQITVSSVEEFDLERLGQFTHVLYYGQVEKPLAAAFTNAVTAYEGSFFAIGYNAEHLGERFSFIRMQAEKVLLSQVEIPLLDISEPLPATQEICVVEPDTSAEVLVTGLTDKGREIPFLVRKENSFFCAGKTVFDPVGRVITEALTAFFDQKKPEQIRYLRLEDVHPRSDPDLLREQAEYLAEKGIPYMVAVIPVYSHGDTLLHFSDAPKLVKVLQYMQANGASIVLHGYRHQYRGSETGEGFEFWDVEYDRPIYQGNTAAARIREDFSHEADYLAFVEAGEVFERAYIEEALLYGVQELVTHKIYPVAFEAPHYAMSGQGYRVVSEHFNAYAGQLQMADHTWKTEYAPPTVSCPSFLHGMAVYPETLGYISTDDGSNSFASIEDRLQKNRKYTRSYLSAFYHPYLGLEGLKQVVEILEQAEDAIWLDLKKEHLIVDIGKIRITAGDGSVTVKKPFVSGAYERDVVMRASIKWIVLVVFVGPYLAFAIVSLIRKMFFR